MREHSWDINPVKKTVEGKGFDEYSWKDWNDFCFINYPEFFKNTIDSSAIEFYINTFKKLDGFLFLEFTIEGEFLNWVSLTVKKPCPCCGESTNKTFDYGSDDITISLVVAGLQAVGVLKKEGDFLVFVGKQ